MRSELIRVLADPQIQVKAMNELRVAPASPLNAEIMGVFEEVTARFWPGVRVLPVMGTGGTDSPPFRQRGIPAYGISGIFTDVDDIREHGRDERIGIREFNEAREFLYALVKRLSN